MSLLQQHIAMEYTDARLRKDHSVVRVQNYAGLLVNRDTRTALLALQAASGVLWLIAVINATNLLLARSVTRQREIAMRGALGASRWRVMQQMIVEGLTLSCAAAVLGAGVAFGSIRLFSARTQRDTATTGVCNSEWIDSARSGLDDSELRAYVDGMASVFSGSRTYRFGTEAGRYPSGK